MLISRAYTRNGLQNYYKKFKYTNIWTKKCNLLAYFYVLDEYLVFAR